MSGSEVADFVSERLQQRDQLVVAAVDVADQIERSVLVLAIVVERLAHDLRRFDVLDRLQDIRVAEPFASEVAERAAQRRGPAAHDVRPELAIGTRRIALVADLLRHVEHDRDRQDVVRARDLEQLLAAALLDVRGVDDGEPALREPFARDVVQHVERFVRRGLVVFVVGHEPAAEVRRKHFRRLEVLARERRLPGAGGADQRDERKLGNLDLHRVNTPICVGGPTSASSVPTGSHSNA